MKKATIIKNVCQNQQQQQQRRRRLQNGNYLILSSSENVIQPQQQQSKTKIKTNDRKLPSLSTFTTNIERHHGHHHGQS
ncbi:hypothetical protein DERF_000287 [Dermatophagoides farinae]|uniref:Uncharacterized protein n=1 Tax=Dermatophagoides farinae TaxID=6954 RepID=A0A922I9V3_DERFA|nr:hypothetical protein DERF_000287 [Dermatophagoides farinae]